MPNDENIFDGPIYYPPIHHIITNKGIMLPVQALSKEEALMIAGFNNNENVFVRPAKNQEEYDFVTTVILGIVNKYKHLVLLSGSAEKVLDIAEKEADKNNEVVHSGYILFGLISEGNNIAGRFLRQKNIKREKILEIIKSHTGTANLVSFDKWIVSMTAEYGFFIDTRYLLSSAISKSCLGYKIVQELGYEPKEFLSDFLAYLENNNCKIGDYIRNSCPAIGESPNEHCPSAYEIYKYLKTPPAVLEKIAIENHLKKCGLCLVTSAFIQSSRELVEEDMPALW